MGFFRKRKKLTLGLRIRQGIKRALASDSKPLHTEENPSAGLENPAKSHPNHRNQEQSDTIALESPMLLLPAELLRDIFSYADAADLQALYETHPRFRAIVAEHRSFFCREIAERDLKYYARYLKPAYFTLQRERRSRFLSKSDSGDGERHGPSASTASWYVKLSKLDKVTKELYSLMPADENEWEAEYLRIQGLSPAQYNPRVWPRPGNPVFYFTHTIISFYQYNSLIMAPKDSLEDFKTRDIKPVCRCAQGYFRSTAHLGILCAVYMACLKFNAEGNGSSPTKGPSILAHFLPQLGGGLGNFIKGTRVSVKELFKMVVVVMHPGNLLKVIKEPTHETMSKLKLVLETLEKVLVRNEEERRRSGVARTYTKGLEMMEGFARYWEELQSEEERQQLRYFEDWDVLDK